jgi:hypothetical protein
VLTVSTIAASRDTCGAVGLLPTLVADVIRVVIDVAPQDSESAEVLATAQRRHNRNLTAIRGHLADMGALRDDVDARLARQIIAYYYGIDGLLRTHEVFGWSLERSNKWALAHACAAVLRSPAGYRGQTD